MVMAVVLSPSLGAAAPDERAAEAVARSLGALVRATIEGVVREAVIVGPAGEGLAEISDHAGCALIEATSTAEGLARAVASARSEIAFVLKGGFAPRSGFVEEAADLLLAAEAFRGALLRRAPDSLLTRLAPQFAEPVGFFAGCAKIRAAARGDLNQMIRRLKIRRTMETRAIKVV
jgi:hypothetical protein